MFLGSRLLTLVAGAVLLVAGRRLYWLIVGLVGFVVGFTFMAEYMQGPDWVILAASLGVGMLAAGLAVFFQKIAVAVAGFLIGGLVVLWFAEQMAWGESWWIWVGALVAGILGSYLTRTVFEVGLIVLSSVLGATFILEGLQRPTDQISIILVVLVSAGVLIQAISSKSASSD